MQPGDELRQVEERLAILLAMGGDRQAFRQLVEWYDRRLLYFVVRILGDSDGALDVLQAVWLSVHRKLSTLAAPEAFRVWIYQIAHNQAVSELRRKTTRPLLLEETATAVIEDSSHDESVGLENAELVHAALQELSVDHRRVLTLRFLEDMSVQEIADVVGCNVGTVKSRLHYARLALRQRIEVLLHD